MSLIRIFRGTFATVYGMSGFSFFLILCLFVVLSQQAADAQNWRPIPNSDSVFDASRVIRISPSVIRVWERYVLNEESLNYMQKKGLADEYRDYSYSISLRQIDCKKRTHGFVNINNFNSRGAMNSPSINIKDSEIEMIPAAPGTNADALIQAVCNYVKKAPKKK